MTPKGVQNLEAALAACRNILDGLGPDSDRDWKEILSSIVSVGQDLKNKFFLKTNLAIPASNACRKNALELEEIAAGGDESRFSEVLDKLKGSMETLLEGADMGGITIT